MCGHRGTACHKLWDPWANTCKEPHLLYLCGVFNSAAVGGAEVLLLRGLDSQKVKLTFFKSRAITVTVCCKGVTHTSYSAAVKNRHGRVNVCGCPPASVWACTGSSTVDPWEVMSSQTTPSPPSIPSPGFQSSSSFCRDLPVEWAK